MFASRSFADSLAEHGDRRGQVPRRVPNLRTITSRLRSKFCIAFALFFLIGLVLRDYLTTYGVRKKSPLTVLISANDARETGELDYWIHRVLARLGRPIDIRVQYPPNLSLVEDSIVAALVDLEQWNWLKGNSTLKNVGLLRIGDETGKDSPHSAFTYVMRPYHFSRYFEPQVKTPHLWVPNGYSKGVGPRLPKSLLPFERRDRLCYFEGSYRDNETPASRENMRTALDKWDPLGNKCEVRWTAGFMEGRSPLEYSAQLGRTRYALTPAGNSGETIRLYEALENNAIPIVVDSPWMAGAFGNSTRPPFIVLNSWDEVGPTLDILRMENSAVGRARQVATRKWWEGLQDNVSGDACNMVDYAFKQARQ